VRPWRRCAGRCFPVPGSVYNALRASCAAGLFRVPAARAPSPRPPAGGWGCALRGGALLPSPVGRQYRRLACRFPPPPPVVRRRDRRRADGDARGAEGAAWSARGRTVESARSLRAREPGTSARGHFTEMPTRSLHARGAVAPGDTSGCPGWVASRASRGPTSRSPPPRGPSPRRRRADGDARSAEGDARRAGGAAAMVCAGSAGGWRTIAPWSKNVGGRPLHRDADAQPARPWRGRAGRCFRLPGLGGITHLAPPDPQPPVRRRAAGARMAMRAGRRATQF
jgi:hypothetical protein